MKNKKQYAERITDEPKVDICGFVHDNRENKDSVFHNRNFIEKLTGVSCTLLKKKYGKRVMLDD